MNPRRMPEKSLLVVAAFSRHPDALEWAARRLIETYGPIAMTSADYPFHHTAYYDQEMGPGLVKRLMVFDGLRPSDILPDVKNHAILLEAEYAREANLPEPRPLNLDPGLLQLGKFLLATTKDQGHRVYLRDNIYAEVTLRFQFDQFEPWPWTYADYREPFVREFLASARGHLRALTQQERRAGATTTESPTENHP